MSRTTNESDDSPLSMDQTHSPSIDEGSSGGGSAGGPVLKKGPWTSTEDALLLDYVKKYGEGNWNAVRKRTGLSRCGKSCRLRWANHLRPNLRKGDFTADEERLIIDLHSEMGNKWARMAQHLPGRTDNEIKNFWNTRIKRRIRKGLPLYPPKPSLHTLSEGQCAQNLHKVISEDARHHGRHQPNSYGIPDVLFDNPVANLGPYQYGSTFPGISASNVVSQGFGPTQSYSYIPLTNFPSKQIRESGTLFPDFSGAVINGMPPFSQFPNSACKKVYHQPFGLADSFPYHLDSSDKNQTPFVGQVTGSHAFQNGNFSASKPPTGAVKLELPSLQYPDKDLSTWTTTSHLSSPSLETVDTYIQSSPPTVQMQSDCLSPHNSDLLDAILYQAKTLSSGKNQLLAKNSSSSVATPAVAMDSSGLSLYKREREDYGDPVSPLGHSAASVSSEYTPISSGSLVESPPENALPRSNNKGKTDEHILTPDEAENEISTRVDSSRPDALLDADWFDHEYAKDMGAFLSDDFFSDNKNVNNGTASSSQSPGWGLNSCRWNNMPVVCRMSELP